MIEYSTIRVFLGAGAMLRIWTFAAIVVITGYCAAPISVRAFVLLDGPSDVLDGLTAQQVNNFQIALAKYKRNPVRFKDSAGYIGWECSLAQAATLAGFSEWNERRRAAENRLRELAIRRSSQVWVWGIADWPIRKPCRAKGEWDAFQDGTCNASNTGYTLQTGLALACLSASEGVHGLATVLAASARYWVKHSDPVADCPDCWFFRNSDSAFDAGRYVRNMNVFLSFGAGLVGQRLSLPDLVAIGSGGAKSEQLEVAARNFGYLGRFDPNFDKPGERERLDNHYVSVGPMIYVISSILNLKQLKHLSLELYRAWATCAFESCRIAACDRWAGDSSKCTSSRYAFGHCYFRNLDALAKEHCARLLERPPPQDPFALSLILTAPADKKR